jgi:hypothetical protein
MKIIHYALDAFPICVIGVLISAFPAWLSMTDWSDFKK